MLKTEFSVYVFNKNYSSHKKIFEEKLSFIVKAFNSIILELTRYQLQNNEISD